jgi:hypothetical protein
VSLSNDPELVEGTGSDRVQRLDRLAVLRQAQDDKVEALLRPSPGEGMARR